MKGFSLLLGRDFPDFLIFSDFQAETIDRKHNVLRDALGTVQHPALGIMTEDREADCGGRDVWCS